MRFGPLGLPEIMIILVVVLLVFGPRRLPDMAKGIGQSVREFRKGIRDMRDDIERDDEPAAKAKSASVSTATTTGATAAAEEGVEVPPAEAPPVEEVVNADSSDWETLKAEQAKFKAEREAFLAEKEQYQAEHGQPHN
jgi:sec-independent protein translocase protein TatA